MNSTITRVAFAQGAPNSDTGAPEGVDLVRVFLTDQFALGLEVSLWGGLALFLVAGIGLLIGFWNRLGRSTWELDQAEIGVGDQKLTLKPNYADRTIAYRVWVELSTRKIGLEIDLDDDVITEVYDSWYAFFQITRDMLKDIPVQKLQDESTRQIVKNTIAILNDQLRPHLTKWQSRFRYWYEKNRNTEQSLSPQEIQAGFPKFEELQDDLSRVNRNLMAYRATLYKLATKGAD